MAAINGPVEVFINHSGFDNDLAKDAQDLSVANDLMAFCTPHSLEGGKWEEAGCGHTWKERTPSRSLGIVEVYTSQSSEAWSG